MPDPKFVLGVGLIIVNSLFAKHHKGINLNGTFIAVENNWKGLMKGIAMIFSALI